MADIDRGQLLLVTALAMAVLFVALALILNTAIYTENLATRGSELSGGGDVAGYVDVVRDAFGGSIDYANAHNNTSETEPHMALRRNLTASAEVWANASGRQYAHNSRFANVSLVAMTNGTQIRQDGIANFDDTSNERNWTVVEDVNRTRAFKIYVTDNDLVSFGTPNEFNITVNDGSTTWRMNVTDDSGIVRVSVQDGNNEEFKCPDITSGSWINVSSGMVGGQECAGLDFAEGVDSPYSITINNGDRVEGKYGLIVDNETLAENPGPHLFDDGNGSPYASPAIYDANVTVTYQTGRLFYNTTIRIAPGESP